MAISGECSRCHEVGKLRQRGPQRGLCPPCARNVVARAWQAANPDRKRQIDRDWFARKRARRELDRQMKAMQKEVREGRAKWKE